MIRVLLALVSLSACAANPPFVDIATLGNHEFDLSGGFLLRATPIRGSPGRTSNLSNRRRPTRSC